MRISHPHSEAGLALEPVGATSQWERRKPPVDDVAVEALLISPIRLQAVASSGLADSPPEESFDALTRLAARLLNVPVSFISVQDGVRDFYKSQCGFPAEVAQARQLSGRHFCHYVLGSDTPLIVDDSHSDPRWLAVPTVQSVGVRAYVGFPLRWAGQTIGSFCVLDIKPRQWTPDELETLRQLALSASRELNLRQSLASAQADSAHARR